MKDHELDQLLEEMRTPLPPPAGFQREVWQRIEAAEPAGLKRAAILILRRFLDFLTLPPVAVATCAGMIAAGTWFGLQTETSKAGGEMAYVQSISPFARTHR